MNRVVAWWLARRVPASWSGPAWRRLLEAADRGDRIAERAIGGLTGRLPAPGRETAKRLWWLVLARPDPDPRLWRHVRGTAWEPLRTVDIAAREDGHPATPLVRAHVLRERDERVLDALGELAADRPGLAAWCAAHDVVPADPATAAVLFLVTGQLGRYHAIDPDAGLLAAAFAAADPPRRQRLLAAVAAAGDIDLAALAGPTAGFWPMVWRLPVAEAVAAARNVPGAPALLEALTRDRGPDRRPLPPPFRRRLNIDLLDLAIAPDASRVAVLDGGYGNGTGRMLDLDTGGHTGHRYPFELSPATHAARAGYWPVSLRVLAHLGDAVIGLDQAGLCRYADGRRRVLVPGGVFANVVRTPGGFAATRQDGRLYLGTADGVERTLDTAVATIAAHADNQRVARGHWLAASPDGAYLAVAIPHALILLDASGTPVATLHPRPQAPRRYIQLGDDRNLGLHGVAFVAPDAFVVLDRTRTPDTVTITLTRYRIGGGTVAAESSATRAEGKNLDGIDGTALLVLEGQGATVLDGRTLEPHTQPELAVLDRSRYPRGAAGWLATGRGRGYRTAEVTAHPPAVCRLLGVPLQEVSLTELRELEAALDTGDPPARPLLETLRDCVRLRYEHDVELGAFAPTDTDIALGDAG